MIERRAIEIRGTVQGVGFRPFVHGLATELSLGGFVRNQSGCVQIEVEGESDLLEQFIEQLTSRPPALAKIDELSSSSQPPTGGRAFVIEASDHAATGPIVIAPDTATCDECLAELFDSRERRYRYPFTNCTNCGPRLSIVTGTPYDRERTTMAGFPMCSACRREYEDPRDRRFHAQPIACPICGPRLQAIDGTGQALNEADPLAWFVAAIASGRIGAMKGLGGYHLVVDANQATAVAELRRRKHRDEKPFAVMVTDLAAAEALCEINAAEKVLLLSSRRPIVLLQKRKSLNLPRGIAPGNPYLGVMLPYTPLHHLLLHDLACPLVMTSGNQSDEPIAYQEPDAIERLTGIADIFLVHDRPIHVRCDDSVTRVIDGIESPIRRSRGYAPQPIRLPIECPAPILAVGAQMKSTFALGRERQAVMSQHMGDLDHFEASRAFERDIALYQQLFSHQPACIAHDLHPDYASTHYAIRRAGSESIPLVAVQHHHAHLASCMAEHGLTQEVIGVIWDGTGYGIDGAIWGGEFLVGDYKKCFRAAHWRYVALPGGEKAVREPWRMATAYLQDAEASCPSFEQRMSPSSLRMVRQMLARQFNSPLSSSVGRLFDAVTSLASVRDDVSYEGQAAIQLESLATGMNAESAYPYAIREPASAYEAFMIDSRPMIRAIATDVNRAMKTESIARRFHSTLVNVISDTCEIIRSRNHLSCVVLSGGVFMNVLLTNEVVDRLTKEGFQVYRQQRMPPNDGGISLGQLAIAASRLT